MVLERQRAEALVRDTRVLRSSWLDVVWVVMVEASRWKVGLIVTMTGFQRLTVR